MALRLSQLLRLTVKMWMLTALAVKRQAQRRSHSPFPTNRSWRTTMAHKSRRPIKATNVSWITGEWNGRQMVRWCNKLMKIFTHIFMTNKHDQCDAKVFRKLTKKPLSLQEALIFLLIRKKLRSINKFLERNT